MEASWSEKLNRWLVKWTAIRDAAQTPEARAYAENYLAMLRRQLRAELELTTEAQR